MGCSSSKVGQKPIEPLTGKLEASAGASGISESLGDPEEARPALPVLKLSESLKPQKPPPVKSERARSRLDKGRQDRRDGVNDGVEGETIVYDSGLQMRTPRKSLDRGLHFAAKTGDEELTKILICNGKGVVEPFHDSEQSCGATAEGSHKTAPVSPMIDINERGMWQNTPLIVAAQYAHEGVALELIQNGADVTVVNERRATALHYACAEGLTAVGCALLAKGALPDPPAATVHHPGVKGGTALCMTPLSAAATAGHTELVRVLLVHGADVNRRISQNSVEGEMEWASALMGAAQYGQTETCIILLDHGASLLEKDSCGRTVLWLAVGGGHEETSLALLDAARIFGISNNLSEAGEVAGGHNGTGRSPLHLACEKGLGKVAEALLATGVAVDAKDAAGATPLLHAIRKGSASCTRQLLLRGACPLSGDGAEINPVLVARNQEHNTAEGKEILDIVEAAVARAESAIARANPIRADSAQVGQGPCVGKGVHDADKVVDTSRTRRDQGQQDMEGEDVLRVSDWTSFDDDLRNCEVSGDGDGGNVTIGIAQTNASSVRQKAGEEAAAATRREDNVDHEDADILSVGGFCLEGNEEGGTLLDEDVLLLDDFDPVLTNEAGAPVDEDVFLVGDYELTKDDQAEDFLDSTTLTCGGRDTRPTKMSLPDIGSEQPVSQTSSLSAPRDRGHPTQEIRSANIVESRNQETRERSSSLFGLVSVGLVAHEVARESVGETVAAAVTKATSASPTYIKLPSPASPRPPADT